MVVTGRAAVDSWLQATVFTQEKTNVKGPGKAIAVRIVFQTQLRPFNCLYKRLDTNPPITPVRAYNIMNAVNNAPLLVGLKAPIKTHPRTKMKVANIHQSLTGQWHVTDNNLDYLSERSSGYASERQAIKAVREANYWSHRVNSRGKFIKLEPTNQPKK